jgi:hypothetical protein
VVRFAEAAPNPGATAEIGRLSRASMAVDGGIPLAVECRGNMCRLDDSVTTSTCSRRALALIVGDRTHQPEVDLRLLAWGRIVSLAFGPDARVSRRDGS